MCTAFTMCAHEEARVAEVEDALQSEAADASNHSFRLREAAKRRCIGLATGKELRHVATALLARPHKRGRCCLSNRGLSQRGLESQAQELEHAVAYEGGIRRIEHEAPEIDCAPLFGAQILVKQLLVRGLGK